MTTSGTYTYTRTAQQISNYALRKLGVLNPTETATAVDMSECIEELNIMLKGWQSHGPNLWRQMEGVLALTANTSSFALPDNVFRVLDCRLTIGGRDIPLEQLSREDYFDLPQKLNTGVPTQFYYDAQIPSGILYIWPVFSSVSTETVSYSYQRKFQDITAQSQTVDIPSEYIGLVGYSLAARIAPSYGMDGRNVQAMASDLMRQADSADREPFIQFQPSSR